MDTTIEIPIQGMDCTECTMHVQKAISGLAGVKSVDVFLASEKAVVQLNSDQVNLAAIREVVESAGYAVPVSALEHTRVGEELKPEAEAVLAGRAVTFTRQALALFAVVFGLVLFVVVAGEGLGLFEAVTNRIPWPLSLAVILCATTGGWCLRRCASLTGRCEWSA